MSCEELLYSKGAHVWVEDRDDVWTGAKVRENYDKGDILSIIKDNGNIMELNIKADFSNLPPLRNPSILIGQNDLTSMSYLHEPGVLYNLRVRFCERQIIYTYCGIILVAINPYSELPLYGSSIIRAYRGRLIGEMQPHVFALAEEAYTKLEREKCNLSIVVSGESGAGKTVSAKYAMRYFAAVGGSESETHIERKVIASSPIMEAFGNAKTTRNDNSSRFGKFTKLLFTHNKEVMQLTGAAMNTYLLEKSRVVFQTLGERNYHIFYQLCAVHEEYPDLILDNQTTFMFLNGGQTGEVASVSDKKYFNETLQAMNVLGFSKTQTSDILRIVAGILHLGNITFKPDFKTESGEIDVDRCEIQINDTHLRISSKLLDLRAEDLHKWLLLRLIESAGDHILIPNNVDAAQVARNSLAKHIYLKLFEYIVSIINQNLNMCRQQNAFIGVLDIYGFETFEINSFEQFCINYANEKLQQQFNQHVFKLEQEEYLKEGITWKMIDFYDNQPCIDLIEAKLGILDLLDEECRMPKGSDESWVDKLVDKCSKFPHFDKGRFGNNNFFIRHFSATVRYDIVGFVEKNRDYVSKELINVIRQSENTLLRALVDNEDCSSFKQGIPKSSLGDCFSIEEKICKKVAVKNARRSVGSQFRESLVSLISTLHTTTPHYIRCIKPNETKIPFKWEAPKIVQQLRACGVLETVRISAAGFPSRWKYHDFYMRYQITCNRSFLTKTDIKQSCQNIVTKWIKDKDRFRFGNTQIFFRSGQVAYLEQIRANVRKIYIIKIQSLVRQFIHRRCFLRLQNIAIGIQRYGRGLIARKKAQGMREENAALIISKYAKGYLCRRRYLHLRHSVCGIQQYARGMISRKRFRLVLQNYRAVQIQRFIRGYLARRAYRKRLHDIIICQSSVRRFLARKEFYKRKAEEKKISHIQKRYKGLENKIISMQQRIDDLNRENGTLKTKTSEISVLRLKLEVKKSLEKEIKKLKLINLESDKRIFELYNQLLLERDEKVQIIQENNKNEEKWMNQKSVWSNMNQVLHKQIDDMFVIVETIRTLGAIQHGPMFFESIASGLRQTYNCIQKDQKIFSNVNNGLNDYFKDPLYYVESDRNNKSIFSNTTARMSELPQIDNNIFSKTERINLLLKLRNLLEEEKKKNKHLNDKLEKMIFVRKSTEDSFRVSELEVENEKLHHDYQLLRNSVQQGTELKELDAHYQALQEELQRRREECIQLKSILQKQSQSIKTIESNNNKSMSNVKYCGDIWEAFQTQKIVNRQLESELSAITIENNSRLAELTQQVEELKEEKCRLESILRYNLDESEKNNIQITSFNERYLYYELEKTLHQSIVLQEELNIVSEKLTDLTTENLSKNHEVKEDNVLGTREHKEKNHAISTVANVGKKEVHNFQGVIKFKTKDIDKILHNLVSIMTPRIATSLIPGFPAYVLIMCIRYTDLINADDEVRELLSKFVMQIKKIHKSPYSIEIRIMWLVNCITFLNLLKQYGDVEEYVKYNTEKQNQQQLKNFNLYEYRRVILEMIINLYEVIVKQVEELLEPYIVPAILDNDEIQRNRQKQNQSIPLDSYSSLERDKVDACKQLINYFEYIYNQFTDFGLDRCYFEQIFKQLLYFVCAVAMNCLMLRGDICMWETGMIIRYNLGYITDWVHERKMSDEILCPLGPLNQISQLLQSRKSEQDVQSICDLCSSLHTAQVLKIMKSYKLDDCEAEITSIFIKKLTELLNQRQVVKNDEFTMDQKFIHSFKVLFKYSDVRLEDIELPKNLNLDNYVTKI